MMRTTTRKKRRTPKESPEQEPLPVLARIRISSDIPSLNDLISGTYKRRITPSKVKKMWRDRLWELQLEQLGPTWKNQIEVTRKHPKRRLEVIRRCRRLLDEDGFWGGLKPVIDALKSENIKAHGRVVDRSAGWFYDDTRTYISVHPIQIQVGEDPWVELILYGRLDGKD